MSLFVFVCIQFIHALNVMQHGAQTRGSSAERRCGVVEAGSSQQSACLIPSEHAYQYLIRQI